MLTVEELERRLGEELNVGREDAPANQLPSTSTAQTVGNAPESEPSLLVSIVAPSPFTRTTAPTVRDTVAAINPSVQVNSPVPATHTIIAFGDRGNNEIWRRGTNKWTKWEKGRDCGKWFACVKAHSNIFTLGGLRGGEISTETDVYDIFKEEWSKGPQLNIGRLDLLL